MPGPRSTPEPTGPGHIRPPALQLVTFRQVPEPRGNLTPVEGGEDLPFAIRRMYWIYDVPGGAARGAHA